MMLADVLREENIITDLKSRDKEEVLGEMVDDISRMVAPIDTETVLKALLDREKLGTTGIGHGVAIPHGKIKGLAELKVFFGRSRKGVNYSSMDNLPVHLVFLILAPENSAAAHLKVLASISHLLKSQDFRMKLMDAVDRSDIYRIITEAEKKSSFV
ncbi:MAG: PTS sugar transporter subunit IIA [Deltaproteobacteria bacterium]|nr:PTS sugar transporter subunit IIA [Deltaproteobacteria bacterium]